ncbi:MAG: SMP-30/gluconolactonase/LRE family protein [Verrucomicrobia subdivision 3 bacterium]|nr:SMP-30/gluconolactonase/LRE family protein [Limisphaerales bacterium]
MKPELVADRPCVIGEGPLWHPTEQRVYWTDIPEGRMFRYDPATGQHESCYAGEVVGGFTIQADGSLLLFMARGAVAIWHAGQLTTVIPEIPDERGSRFNDVIADPAGRVFCGTMPCGERAGRLYRLDTDGRLTKLLDGIGCSNGMGFTPDRRHLYYTDSAKREIYRFDYDVGSGDLANRRLFARTPENEGVPDGLTVDAEGGIWSARWDGGALVRFTPDGREERRIQFPARKVSSVTFGGDDLDDLYVTTAGGDQRATEGAGAGALFRLRPGVRGLPEFCSRVGG